MAEALGVIGLYLNDRSCSGKRNATHWMVKTLVTSCGSTSRIDGKLTTYSNAVRRNHEKNCDHFTYLGYFGRENKLFQLVVARNSTKRPVLKLDGKYLYFSQVHIQLGAMQHQQNDDEDFEGSGHDGYPSSTARQVTIPIQCHSEPNFPVSFGDKMDDDNVMVRQLT